MPRTVALTAMLGMGVEMSIEIEHDGSEPGDVQENCCKCRTPTRYWYGKGAANVALCPRCADEYTIADLPTKKEWTDAERARMPRPFWTLGHA